MSCAFLSLLLALAPPRGTSPPPELGWGGTDFVQFYAAARLLGSGANPYDEPRAAAIQVAVGHFHGLKTYNPPTSFLPYLALGLLDYPAAVKANLLLNALLLLGSVLLWARLLFPDDGWLTLLLAAAAPIWLPTLAQLGVGQITAWLVFGFAGWAWASMRGRPALAGVCLALCVMKPHLGLPLLAFGASRMLGRKEWAGLAALAGAIAWMAAAVTLLRPTVWGEHLDYLRTVDPPTVFYSATLDGWGRWTFGIGFRWGSWALWLGGTTLLGLWGRRQKDAEALPAAALLVSCLAPALAPHAFLYDFVLLLPGWLLAVGEGCRRARPRWAGLLIGWLLLDSWLALGKAKDIPEHWFFFVPWAAVGIGAWFLWPRLSSRAQA